MKLNVSGISKESIVDGIGIRYVIFTQGCPHNCEGCHNPQTHEFAQKTIMDTQEIIDAVKINPLLKGVTFSGGEPFCQAEALFKLSKELKKIGMDIWCYSGYTYEQLQKNIQPFSQELLTQVDVLVDGKFILAKRDLTLKFRGSENQRIIDCNETRKSGEIKLLDLSVNVCEDGF